MDKHAFGWLILMGIILVPLTGCHVFPGIRCRNPHSPEYEQACVCGLDSCPECSHVREQQTEVPWPMFHPVPSRPVFESRQEFQQASDQARTGRLNRQGLVASTNSVSLPPLAPVPKQTQQPDVQTIGTSQDDQAYQDQDLDGFEF